MKEWKLVLAGGLIGMLGMGAGAWVFGSRPVEAQEQVPQVHYRDCFFARQESVDVDDRGMVARPEENRLIHVPNGWVVAGGAGNGASSTVLLCRP